MPVQSVYAIIVTYHPAPALLARLLAALSTQVVGGVVVNNGAALPLADQQLQAQGFARLDLPQNQGIAAALNAGFVWAQQQGAEYVVTFDQDSEPAPGMVQALLHAWQQCTIQGLAVGAIGPQQVDSRTLQRTPFIAPIAGRRKRLLPADGAVVEVDHLITSGCLTTPQIWQQSGGFLEALFIDYVDIEWCLRLRHAGFKVLGLGGAVLCHSLGDAVNDWRGQSIPQHSPLRHYYLVRNGVYLLKLAHIPWVWKLSDAWHTAKKFVYFAITSRPRWPHIAAMLRGAWDGVRNRLGAAARPY